MDTVLSDYHTKEWKLIAKSPYTKRAKKGLDISLIKSLSKKKTEPEWMLQKRLEAYSIYLKKKLPKWGADLSGLNFEDIYYYLQPNSKKVSKWEDLPKDIKKTYDYLKISEAEKNFLAGVSAQYESEVLYK